MPARLVRTRRIGRALVVAAALGSLGAISPALAQSAASRIDQPTPGTMPAAPDRETQDVRVAPPGAIRSSTDVMQSDGTVQGQGAPARTNPIQHLPETMR